MSLSGSNCVFVCGGGGGGAEALLMLYGPDLLGKQEGRQAR